ncbi:MAG: flagellar basal body L-ring protein FlgH [Pseudomonadota bacterium]
MRTCVAIVLLVGVAGCGTGLNEVGQTPTLSPISLQSAYPPMPKEQFAARHSQTAHVTNSAWRDSGSTLFLGSRAADVGDIITVNVAINDRANLDNSSDRSRSNSRSVSLSGSADIGSLAAGWSGDAAIGGGSTFTGDGSTKRSEQLRFTVPVVVYDKLPTGNLLVSGSQEIAVNAELRLIQLQGIIRPSDIGPNNVISYDRIAEARIRYGGRGRITEVQQPSYGQQILDKIVPF